MAWNVATLTAWTPEHLETAAAFATEQVPLWLEHFETHLDQLAAMESWNGASKAAALEAAQHSAMTAIKASDPTISGAAQLTEIAGAATAMQEATLGQIGMASADGLVVSPDLKKVTGPPGTQELAEAHAGMIKHYLAQFQGALADGAQRIREQSQELGTVGFSDSGVKLTNGHSEPHVSMVDNKFKLGGGDPWDNPDVPIVGDDQGQDTLLGPGSGTGASTQSGLGSQDTRLPPMPSQWPPTESAPPDCMTPQQVKDKLAADAARAAVLGAIPGGVLGGPLGAASGAATAAITNDTGDLLDFLDGTKRLCEG